jgi:tryptophan synthase alpha chain
MPRIEDTFAALRAGNKKALIPFVTGGFPRPGALAQLLPAIAAELASRAMAAPAADGDGGATPPPFSEAFSGGIIEIGIPFSDPIADGPVIAGSMHAALERGSTPATVFEEVASVRESVPAALVAMVSASIVMKADGGGAGAPAAFCRRARSAGFDGVIVPDLPLEESRPMQAAAAGEGLSMIMLVAPSTSARRAAEIAKASTGFVYLLARSGITGERAEMPDLRPLVATLRSATNLPIACGFGISTPAHVRTVCEQCEGAIVGSALVRRIKDADDAGRDPVAEAALFVRELAAGLP